MARKSRARGPTLPASTLRCLELVGAERLAQAQKVIGRRFKTPALLAQALVHSSCQLEVEGRVYLQSNEKLEQIGDKVVGLAVTRYLHKRYPQYDESFFSPIIGKAASNVVLDRCAKEAGLPDLLVANRTSKNLKDIQGWTKVWADTFEAVVAALYLDGDGVATERFFKRHLYPKVDALVEEVLNPSVRIIPRPKVSVLLHDYMHRNGLGSPRYEYERSGIIHTASVFGRDGGLMGTGSGETRPEAKRIAAEVALRALEADTPPAPAAAPEPSIVPEE